MSVILAKSAGFCFGVKRAVETVYDQVKNNSCKKRIYTYGPIIHNSEVVDDLRTKGVGIVEDEDSLKDIASDLLIIRSHGVKRSVLLSSEKYGIEVIDATCPFVKKIHRIAEKDSREGRLVIIAGDPEHPEVTGITGWVDGDFIVVKNEDDAQALANDPGKKATLVAQTTFNANKFNKLVEIISKKGYDIKVTNTICNATHARQKEAEEISSRVDVMLVVGDKNSSNTQKLYDICVSNCKDTYYIQTIKDLDNQILQSGISVGITAGASTPNYIIQEVFLTCQKKKVSAN